MKFHVIADAKGELLAWIKASPTTESGPRVAMLPGDPAHVLHENIEIEDQSIDRTNLSVALQKALADRIRHRR